MGTAQKSHANGQSTRTTQLRLNPPKGSEVIGHHLNIVCIADLKTRFFVEQINQGGLRAFDLRVIESLL